MNEILEDGNLEKIEQMIESGEVDEYSIEDFNDQLLIDANKDLEELRYLAQFWNHIDADPKLEEFKRKLQTDSVLKERKLIIFTESKETAIYLTQELTKINYQVLCFTSSSDSKQRERVIENFDQNAQFLKNDFKMLVTTDTLAEGVNLHQSNVVVNYDLPWNPMRVMQRVGRINRVDTKYDKIYVYNFFPTEKSNNAIALEETAKSKVAAFITLLGNDAQLLTDNEPIESYELFEKLNSKSIIEGEDDIKSELKYLAFIKEIREKQPNTFDKIKRLPKKARTGRNSNLREGLLTYIRTGNLQKFYINGEELDFVNSAEILDCEEGETRISLGDDFYELLEKNKTAFKKIEIDHNDSEVSTPGRTNEKSLLKYLRYIQGQINLASLTDDQLEYLDEVVSALVDGLIPKKINKIALGEIQSLFEEFGNNVNPLQVIGVLQSVISTRLLEQYFGQKTSELDKKEIILSEYCILQEG